MAHKNHFALNKKLRQCPHFPSDKVMMELTTIATLTISNSSPAITGHPYLTFLD